MSDRLRAGFYTYPWDLMEDPEGIISQMSEELGCNAIMLNAQYHHARLLRPRQKGPKTYQTYGASAAFTPNPVHYQKGGLIPIVDQKLANSEVVKKTGQASRQFGLDFGIWVVGLHNSSFGKQYPDLCMENSFGDIYTYALCPSREDNRLYFRGLVRDVCAQFKPDRVAVEAVGYLGLRHWDHHELFMVEWDQALELLTGICFCGECSKHGEEAGIDVKALRGEINMWTEALLNEEPGGLPENFRTGDVGSLLMEIEGLRAYLKAGESVVSSLVVELKKVADEFGVELGVIPASFHRPSSNSWLERASIKALGEACGRLMISSYFVTAAEVKADLGWVMKLAGDIGISAGINACAPTPGVGVLAAQVQAAISAGADSIYYYNYGLLTQKRLDWVAQVNNENFG